MPYSEKLKEILGGPKGVLAGISGQRAAIRVAQSGSELSSATILKLKQGIYGEESSLRTLARAYARELLEQYRDAIKDTFDITSINQLSDEDWVRLVQDWLVSVAVTHDTASEPYLRRRDAIYSLEWGADRIAEEQQELVYQIADQAAMRATKMTHGAVHFVQGLAELQRKYPGCTLALPPLPSLPLEKPFAVDEADAYLKMIEEETKKRQQNAFRG